MLSVQITALVEAKLEELFEVLIENDYFSDIENVRGYCNNIREFIFSLPEQKHYFTRNNRWGNYYAAYRFNRKTTWYITFDNVAGELYLVRNLFNNHTEEYPLFIKG